MEEQRAAGKMAKGAQVGGKKASPRGGFVTPCDSATSLAKQGVDKDLAKEAHKAAAMSEPEFENQVTALSRLTKLDC
jgi:hypothetical protein